MQPDAHKRALIAGSIGNFIEWYEFAVYGFLAVSYTHLTLPTT